VIAGDHWIWALIALLLGAGLAYCLVELREMVRPKRVLQLALTRAQARHAANVAAVDGRGLGKPYTLGAMFPSGAWDCALRPTTEAVDLFCRIDRAPTQEELDVIAEQVADLERRINTWPSVCAKADALKNAKDQLDGRPHATNMKSASEKLIENAGVPTDEAATKAYMKSLDEQVEAVREWLAADALFDEGLRLFKALEDPPRRHDPARWLPDLEAAKSLTDLKRCRVVPGLCRDVHLLRTLVVKRQPKLRRRMVEQKVAGAEAAAAQPISIKSAPPALEGPALTRYLKAVIVAADLKALVLTTTVVAITYLVGIYSDTWGSIKDYLTAFAAGAGGTFAASWKLLPWYTTFKRPKPSA
jgi:hypothetical protein